MNFDLRRHINKVVEGNVFELIKTLPDNCIDCVITSPPYYRLRDYKTDDICIGGDMQCVHEWVKIEDYKLCSKCGAYLGSFGLEPTVELYVEHLVTLFEDIKRVLKPTGNVFVNIGDSFAGSGGMNKGKQNTDPNGKTKKPCKNNPDLVIEKLGTKASGQGYNKPKQKLLVPHRFAIAMQESGWICRGDWIWYKTNSMPSPVDDRLNEVKEYVFHFVKSRKYFFHLEAVKIPCKPLNRWGGPVIKVPNNTKMESGKEYAVTMREKLAQPDVKKNPGDVLFQQEKQYSVVERDGNVIFRDLPSHVDLRTFLNNCRKNKLLSINDLEKIFGGKSIHHWFEENGSYPTVEDWKKLKELNIIPGDNDFNEKMETEYLKPAEKQDTFKKNPGDVLIINTKPCLEAHFAVMPEELVEFCLKAGVPLEVCEKCGKPKVPEYEKTGELLDFGGSKKERDLATEVGVSETSLFKTGYVQEKKLVGYNPTCSCGVGFIPGVVIDPFMGSGTVGVVAKKYGCNYIGFELNPDYVKIAETRLEKIKRISDGNSIISYTEKNEKQLSLFE